MAESWASLATGREGKLRSLTWGYQLSPGRSAVTWANHQLGQGSIDCPSVLEGPKKTGEHDFYNFYGETEKAEWSGER